MTAGSPEDNLPARDIPRGSKRDREDFERSGRWVIERQGALKRTRRRDGIERDMKDERKRGAALGTGP